MAFIAAGGEIKETRPQDPGTLEIVKVQETKVRCVPARISLSDAVAKYLERCRTRQGKSGYGMASRIVNIYEYRLGFLLEYRPPTEAGERERGVYLDEIDKDFVYRFLAFLRKHKSRLADRSCYNIVQAVSTFLIHYGNRSATGVLKEIGYPPTEVIPYGNEQLGPFFAACTEKEDLLFKFFLHTMARDMEVLIVKLGM
jgi:hypothetical protein